MGKFDGILLVSDLDSTLLTNDKRISEGNRAAIDRFVAAGGRFTFITGRSPIGTGSVFAQYTPDAPVGCLNGGAVYDARTKQYAWSLPLDPRAEVLVDYVIDRFPDIGVALNGFEEIWIQKNNPLTDVYRKLESLPYVEKRRSDKRARTERRRIRNRGDRAFDGGLTCGRYFKKDGRRFAFLRCVRADCVGGQYRL